VVPRSQLGKDLKRHHTLHHLKDEKCWLAFTATASVAASSSDGAAPGAAVGVGGGGGGNDNQTHRTVGTI